MQYAPITAKGSTRSSSNANKLHVKLYMTSLNLQAITCITNQPQTVIIKQLKKPIASTNTTCFACAHGRSYHENKKEKDKKKAKFKGFFAFSIV